MLDLNLPSEKMLPFSYFFEISKIPHGSGNCGKIADYLVSFAKKHGLNYERDEHNNVLIRKPATAGYENRPTVILQGHTDMVAEKAPSSDIDMSCEGLRLFADGDLIGAVDTTLGGDDGIAVAYMLAILSSSDIPHPALEALFTSDEEIGLIGASLVDGSWFSGKTLINIDSEEEGVFTVGCAGGVRVDMSLGKKACERLNEGVYSVKVDGLIGGHSGVEIDKGRANAARIIAEILSSLDNVRISSIKGGNMDNAIMRECEAVFTTSLDDGAISKKILSLVSKIRDGHPDDGPIRVSLNELSEGVFFTYDDSRSIVSCLNSLPFGVLKMSEDIAGLPESSANIGVVRISAEADSSYLTSSLRSSSKSELARMKGDCMKIAEGHGFTIDFRGEYPAWEYRKDSRLRDCAVALYRKMYGKEPVVMTIHAGLECGALSQKIEGLDCISIGPDMTGIHTTEERLSVSSSVRVYEFILALIKAL